MDHREDFSSKLAERFPIIKEIQDEKELAWINPDKTDYEGA